MRINNRPEGAPVKLRPDEVQKLGEERAKSAAALRASGLRNLRRFVQSGAYKGFPIRTATVDCPCDGIACENVIKRGDDYLDGDRRGSRGVGRLCAKCGGFEQPSKEGSTK